MARSCTLVSDFDRYDNQEGIHDVLTGLFIQAMSELPALTRQLLEDSDIRVELKEDEDGHYKVVKFIKKRDPEFLQGSSHHFVLDPDGRRVPVTEDQLDEIIGLKKNEEDIYTLYERGEIEHVPYCNSADDSEEENSLVVEEEFHCPRDVWDVVWDETEFNTTVERLKNDKDFNNLSEQERETEIEWLRDGKHPLFPDVREYSADYFPHLSHKQCLSPKAHVIAAEIVKTGLSRGQLARKLSEPGFVDQRPIKAQKCREEAAAMPNGPEKARLYKQANAMMECYHRSQKAMRTKRQASNVTASDKRHLWAIWRDQQLAKTGKVELTQWQYEKALYAKLVRSGVAQPEATERVKVAVKKIYNSDKIGQLTPHMQ